MSRHTDGLIPAIVAGFVAVLVSYAGPLAIVFQAGQSAGISDAMLTSWVWAISLGAAVSGIGLSLWLRVPVITAWSAPGTALLVTLFPELSLNEAVGAYLVAAAVILVIGVTGSFDRIIRAIPPGIASAMMAGILFQFGVGVFTALPAVPGLVLGMLLTYLVFRRLTPRYCLVVLLIVGIALAVGLEGASLEGVALETATPRLIHPEWRWDTTLSLAIPLVLVSLTGQFLPGMAILRAAGYRTPARPIVAVTGLISLFTAWFGGITTVIAAITAAICTGEEAHPDPKRRYLAGVACGGFYLVGACFAGSIVLLFTSLPDTFIAVLAGLALVGAIASNIRAFAAEREHLEASVITFLATASGVSFLGLGAAFWGVVIGGVAHLLLHHPLSSRRADSSRPRAGR
ncbi:benzoate/H(+) symporter BenE family transporter [Halomonas koreensis]|uniref:Benzoate/H(+) symporter BenE family transporter n=1 Tax=Halomonas koreensis TaxID=245385 RepID=A0ABU1G1V0_9GAMM|nr:benzoate/H(+) symporter BenE family transporter [Halomonas koreensis]MDR5866686.1 benzoate/H(+) symporter BenE family transporter [Halomonas koreensis]